jgi:rare lipoprotein A
MRALGFWLLAALLLTSCGRKQTVRLPPPTPAIVGAGEVGIASWYGHPYHGRRTSNGEVYDMNLMTAAHLSLPFGTVVRVTNLTNNRFTEVRINDRGPFVKDRIIDLSRSAAREIAMIGPGTARVRVEVIATPAMASRTPAAREPQTAPVVEVTRVPTVQEISVPVAQTPSALQDALAAQSDATLPVANAGDALPCPAEPYFGVQVGTFASFENAVRLQGRLMQQYGAAEVVPEQGRQGALYRVVVGRTQDFAAAGDLLASMRQTHVDGFVTRVDGNPAADCL